MDDHSLSPTLSLPAHSSWGQLTSASRWWKPHQDSPICARQTSPSKSLCGPELKYILKKHIPRQNTWNANPLYRLDLVPFPQRCTDLSHIHPQTWTCRKHTVDRFSAPCFSLSVRLLPDRLSFVIHSGFCKISVFYSSLIQRLRETSSQAQYREPSTYCMLLKPAHSDRFQGYS